MTNIGKKNLKELIKAIYMVNKPSGLEEGTDVLIQVS